MNFQSSIKHISHVAPFFWSGVTCSAAAMECPAAKFDPATRACVIVCVHGIATPSGSCLCDAGWAGAQCNQTCPGFAAGLVCGGHPQGAAGPFDDPPAATLSTSPPSPDDWPHLPKTAGG